MPQTLVNEFIERRKSGEPFGTSLKEAVFQAKSSIGDYQDDNENKFKLWKVNMRGPVDNDPVQWWFTSTAVPLLAATLGPLANVLSIGALITTWRVELVDPSNPQGPLLSELLGARISDPKWCYWVNIGSLILGFVGNLLLLLNFTNRIRYIISLPMSIMLWFFACSFLIADLAAMHSTAPPVAPTQAYSEGFWYAVAAASMYLILSMLLMSNLLGYIRGHYPQHFELTEDQRTLIVQTMLFFLWLAGGGGVYSHLEGWRFVDALYFCDVSILTIGFGDLFPASNVGRALLIPYSMGGIIMLGLVISSIFKSVSELGEKNIIRNHYEKQREQTIGRTVTTSLELERREIEVELAHERAMLRTRSSARSPATLTRSATFESLQSMHNSVSRRGSTASQSTLDHPSSKYGLKQKSHILLLREESERFHAMRRIQKQSEVWKSWWRLSITLSVFAVFWCVGAVVFWQAEKGATGMTYWQAVYFCWISLLTIGYGDFSPKTGAGRTFFIIWSLVAVPTMTILAGDLTSTVVSVFNSWSAKLADFTILPQQGIWSNLVSSKPWLFLHLPKLIEKNLAKPEPQEGIDRSSTLEFDKEKADDGAMNDAYAAGSPVPDLQALAKQHEEDLIRKIPDAAALARQLALAIKRAAHDMTLDKPRQYTYEEWVEFTRLIRFSAVGGQAEAFKEEEDEGLIQWDWLAENSPMMAQQNESEFVLERLCESLIRYLRRNPPHAAFSGSLREHGEDALRLRTKTWQEDKPGPESDSFEPKIRRPGVIAKPAADADDAQGGGLHILHEVDDEHHHSNDITPVK